MSAFEPNGGIVPLTGSETDIALVPQGAVVMKIFRRRFLHLAAIAAALPVVSRVATAQTYPSRPVRLVVGFTAGGNFDIVARLMGQWLSEQLHQPFIVENRPGAGTNIA